MSEWQERADLVRSLTSFFTSEGWEVFDHVATIFVFNPDDSDDGISIDLDEIATHLIREGYRK